MILILGGGLAGLSTAYHLARLAPGEPRLVLEQESAPGGLCRSRRVDGFTFDYTGHYLHLRDSSIRELVDGLLGDRLVRIERRSKIHIRGALLEFPFQANLHGLPPEVVARCVIDFVEAWRREPPDDPGLPFGTWARRVFGAGIADEFMIPYNRKLFLADPEDMTSEWVAWSVPRPDLAQVVHGALGIGTLGMGYNPAFLYPREGGIGALAAALAEDVGSDVRVNAKVVSVDARARHVVLEGGELVAWDRLVSTVPLPYLLQRTRGLDTCDRHSGSASLADLAGRLRSTMVLEVALGIDRAGIADGLHWIYFPEEQYPFYRAGFPSNVCPALAPAGCGSVSVEFAHRPGSPVPQLDELAAAAREGLEAAGILHRGDRIVAGDLAVIEPGYVVFDRARTPAVSEALARLRGAGIESIGRYGAWTYSYMERALIDGREAARRLAGAAADVPE